MRWAFLNSIVVFIRQVLQIFCTMKNGMIKSVFSVLILFSVWINRTMMLLVNLRLYLASMNILRSKDFMFNPFGKWVMVPNLWRDIILSSLTINIVHKTFQWEVRNGKTFCRIFFIASRMNVPVYRKRKILCMSFFVCSLFNHTVHPKTGLTKRINDEVNSKIYVMVKTILVTFVEEEFENKHMKPTVLIGLTRAPHE